MKELKICDIFEWGGVYLQVEELSDVTECLGCFFDGKFKGCFNMSRCSDWSRSDNKNVIFREVKTPYMPITNHEATAEEQLNHLLSEMEEVKDALCIGDKNEVIVELYDVILTANKMIEIVSCGDKQLKDKLYKKTIKKNLERGYYEFPKNI